MSDIILRNLDPTLKQALRERAAGNGRSMSAELRDIVRAAVGRPSGDTNAEFKKRAAALRAKTPGSAQTPAGVLQREGRDER